MQQTQRLTTLTLIYITLYRLAIEINNKELKEEILETFLTNKFATENEKLKLRQTENNDKAIKFLLRSVRSDETEECHNFSKVIDNYNYFKSRINEQNYTFFLKAYLN